MGVIHAHARAKSRFDIQFALQTLPIWSFHSVEAEADLSLYRYKNLMVAMEFADKQYGLDGVFERVLAEDILLPFDFNRIKFILDTAFATKSVEASQRTYLQRKYKTIKRDHVNTFTELYMNNLLHLVDHLDDMDEIEFLPDLQQTETSCSRSDMGKQLSPHVVSRVF